MEEGGLSRTDLEQDLRAWIGTSKKATSTLGRLKVLPSLTIVQERARGDAPHQTVEAIRGALADLLPSDGPDWPIGALRILARVEGDGTAEQRRDDANSLAPSKSASASAFKQRYELPVLVPRLAELIMVREGGEWIEGAVREEPARAGSPGTDESHPTVSTATASRRKPRLRLRRRMLLAAAVAALLVGSVLVWRASYDSNDAYDASTPTTAVPSAAQQRCVSQTSDPASDQGTPSLGEGATALNGLAGHLGVANVTGGAAIYSSTTAAAVDDIVKVQVTYANLAERSIPDVSLKLNIPTDPGIEQRITAQLASGDEEVNVAGSVSLSDANARLQFVTGSVQWRHNVSPSGEPAEYRTVVLGDDPVLRPTPIENLQPGSSYAATITALVRVVSTDSYIESLVRGEADESLSAVAKASADAEVEVVVRLTNTGNTVMSGVVLLNNIPPGTTYVAGSTQMTLTDSTGGVKPASPMPDGIVDPRHPTGAGRAPTATPGLPIGDLKAGETADLSFQLRVSPTAVPGDRLTNTSAIAWPCTSDSYDISTILVV